VRWPSTHLRRQPVSGTGHRKGYGTGNKGNAMTAIEAQLIERLKKLPPSRVAEVADSSSS